MKRRIIALALLSALLFTLSACRADSAQTPAMQQPFDFYYRTAVIDYESESGLIRAETVDLGDKPISTEALVARYLQGPSESALVSPFPHGVSVREVSLSSSILTLRLSGEYAALQGVDASIADACIVKTMLGLSNVRRVRILSEDESGTVLRSVLLDSGDILLSDEGAGTDATELTLYFADAEGRYLLTEKRTASQLSSDALPQYMIEQLILGPQTAGLYPTVPVGTVLLDVNVENGVCAVDLSAAFVENRADTGLPPHLTLCSLANTLTELDFIDSVQFYIDGRQPQSFGVLPLGESFLGESRAVGPVHPELRELDGTLCLPVAGTHLLYPLTLRVKSSSNESQAEAALRVLFSYAPQNGFENPLYSAQLPRSVQLAQGVCTVDLPDEALLSAQTGMLAARMIVATLCAQEDVDAVRILVNGQTPTVTLPTQPETGWYCQPPLE